MISIRVHLLIPMPFTQQNSNRQNYDISESYAESHLMVDRKLERVTFVHLKRGHDKHIQIIDDYKHKIRLLG